jgi:hypothetical protein
MTKILTNTSISEIDVIIFVVADVDVGVIIFSADVDIADIIIFNF